MIRDRRAILALLTGLNFLNFIDRAVFAAVLKPMSRELSLSNFEGGLLNTAFLIGYFATSPWFGARADKGARKGLIALGIGIWSLATIGSGLATGFWSLLAARVVVGVGEASFAALAPTIIDDLAPPDRKGKALAVFYLAIPLGFALGYMLGGTIGNHWGWRAAFFVPGGPGVVIALSCLLIAEPARKLAEVEIRLIEGLRELVEIPLFRRAVLGYCAYTGALGAFSVWAPKFLLDQFPAQLNLETANFWFGLVLLAGGAVGTFIGGRWADRSLRDLSPAAPGAPYDAPEHKTQVNALLRICALGMAIAAPVAALGLFVPGPLAFFIISFLVNIGLFASTSPVNAAFLRAVPVERRASAMAASIFAIHAFGDLWSAAVLGLLLDVLVLRVAMMSLPLTFAWAAYIWWPRRREAAVPGSVPQARVHTAT